MGFWIFMLLMDLLIPVTMIAFGGRFAKRAPEKINPVFGYRTDMSMKNRDTWEFAHRYCGKLWRTWGAVSAPVTVALMLPVLGKDVAAVGVWGMIVCGLQAILLIAPIFFTEAALRKTFDGNGNRK